LKVLHTQQTAWNNGDIENFMKGYWKNDSCFLSVQKDQLTVGKKHWTITKKLIPIKK
jgi:hypothetical protein